MKRAKRHIYFAMAWLFVLLGFIGAFLPIMPTVPFLLLATVCFSRSSKRWHQWIVGHPRWGAPILEWQEKGVIRKKAKIFATVLIFISFSGSMFFVRDRMYLVIMLAGIMASLYLFIWTRPSE